MPRLRGATCLLAAGDDLLQWKCLSCPPQYPLKPLPQISGAIAAVLKGKLGVDPSRFYLKVGSGLPAVSSESWGGGEGACPCVARRRTTRVLVVGLHILSLYPCPSLCPSNLPTPTPRSSTTPHAATSGGTAAPSDPTCTFQSSVLVHDWGRAGSAGPSLPGLKIVQ
jgi:hypothetical protein